VTYYQRIEPPAGLADIILKLLEAIDLFTAKGMLGEAAKARRVVQDFARDLTKLEAEGPPKADEFIRKRLRATAVRPATSGTLAAAVQSHPLPSRYPSGAVGIADIATLDSRAINPRSGGIYWRAQEWGLPGLTPADYARGGRKVAPGYFMPGFSTPSQGSFRAHPYFQQYAYAKGMPALMRLRPVPARHFLRDGTEAWRLLAWTERR
jgi:hypothetical protein